ncbi:MAG TPA: hypothetical protein VGG05_03575 [Pseudonocardiaceae bacterium]
MHFALPGGGLNVPMLLVQPPPIRVLKIAAAMRSTMDAGVTTVRDLGFLGPSLAKMATMGATPAPRLLNAIAVLSGSGGHGDFPFPAGDPSTLPRVLDLRFQVADGRDAVTKAVRELIRDGAQVIKVAASRVGQPARRHRLAGRRRQHRARRAGRPGGQAPPAVSGHPWGCVPVRSLAVRRSCAQRTGHLRWWSTSRAGWCVTI